MKEFLKRILGYFGTGDKTEGPTVLGMETNLHKDPNPAEIRKAVREAKEMFNKEQEDMKLERLD